MHHDRTADTAAVEAAIRAMVAAWNAGDAEAYGACFTADATYVTWVGTRYQGRGDIIHSHAALFRTFLRGTVLADEIVDIRFVAPGAAIVSGNGEIVKAGKRPEDAKLTFMHSAGAAGDTLLLELRSPLTLGTRTYPAGALLAADFPAWRRGERRVQMLFEPTPTRSLHGYATTRRHVSEISLPFPDPSATVGAMRW